MAITSVASLIVALCDLRLLEPEQIIDLTRRKASFSGLKTLHKELIERGWLTAFQLNQVVRGQAQELLLGSYVLLERLGEGGMGEVFKARHQKLGRVVAIKLMRKERLANADAV